jgi:hypothetical protein
MFVQTIVFVYKNIIVNILMAMTEDCSRLRFDVVYSGIKS